MSETTHRVLVVVNPMAGSVTPELLDLIRDALTRIGATPDVRTTAFIGDATFLVGEYGPGAATVVSVGGDGTLAEVVAGLIGIPEVLRPTLLVLPAGTGNSAFLSQWGATPVEDVLAAVADGTARRRHLDLAELEELGETMLLGACSGVLAEALVHALGRPERGRERYRAAFGRALAAHRPYPGRVTVDGVVVQEGPTVLVNVGGGRVRAGTYAVLPHSELDDGELDVCVVGDQLPPREACELIVSGAHLGRPGVVYARGRRVVVERTDGEPLCFERDGDLRNGRATRFTARVLPHALAVLCAPEPAARGNSGGDRVAS